MLPFLSGAAHTHTHTHTESKRESERASERGCGAVLVVQSGETLSAMVYDIAGYCIIKDPGREDEERKRKRKRERERERERERGDDREGGVQEEWGGKWRTRRGTTRTLGERIMEKLIALLVRPPRMEYDIEKLFGGL